MPLPFVALGIMSWMKNNWQLVAVGIAAAALAGYVGFLKLEVSHYKGKYEDSLAVIAQMERKAEQLQASFDGLEKKYADALVETKQRTEENVKHVQELIQKDVELNTLRISYAAVGLFNATKRDPAKPAPAKPVDAGKTGTADPTGTANGLGKSVTLSQVFQIVALNDGNHWKCVKQVEAWQGWYSDVEKAIEQAARVK